MAYSTTTQNINRKTSGLELPASVVNQVLANTQEGSAVMQLANRMVIPGSGVKMSVITGDPAPVWTEESKEKQVSTPTFETLTMTPYTLAVIVPFTNQFRRDMDALYDAIVERLPLALAEKFDATVLHGAAPGAGFMTLANADAVDIETDTYAGLVSAKTGVSIAGGMANGWVLAPQAEPLILGAKGASGHPIFVESAIEDGRAGRILGAPTLYRAAAYKAGTPNCVGIIGDWGKATYGIVEDVKLSITEEATINNGTEQVNLWQRNMFAVRAELEVGFVCQSDDYFKRLTDASNE